MIYNSQVHLGKLLPVHILGREVATRALSAENCVITP